MNVTLCQCNQCGKQVSDFRVEKGWIRLTCAGQPTLQTSNPADLNKPLVARLPNPIDWCSDACMVKYIKAQTTPAPAADAKKA